nr:hypothetical protein [Tanacetum cinerariifolium]
ELIEKRFSTIIGYRKKKWGFHGAKGRDVLIFGQEIHMRVAFHAINVRRLPLAPLVYTLVRPSAMSRRIVLSIEDKFNYLEQPIPPAPVVPAGQHVAPEILAAHTAWIKGSKEIVGLMLMTMEPDIQ